MRILTTPTLAMKRTTIFGEGTSLEQYLDFHRDHMRR